MSKPRRCELTPAPWRRIEGLLPGKAGAYKARNLFERCFYKLKYFRRTATRCDRHAANVPSFILLATALLWMR